MPLGDRVYGNATCEAYFGGLLPESEAAKKAIGQRYGFSANNTFSLLSVIGHDCAGAVSLMHSDRPAVEDEWHEIAARPLSDAELAQHVRELPNRPLFVGVEQMRLSLAGVQDKAAVVLLNGEIYVPKDDCPTTHILKPEISGFVGSVQNEYLSMRLAKKLGLPTAEVMIRRAEDITLLLVARYDREVVGNRVKRIHQEDFCQALGIQSSRKYQKEGGPTFSQCFDLMMGTLTPAANRNMLAEVLVFNLLTGNADAHGKNFSLLHLGPEAMTLAPFYDLLSTQSFPQLSQEMAMKIGGTYYGAAVTTKDWEKLCRSIGYGFPMLRQIVKRQTETLPEFLATEREALKATAYDHKIADGIIGVLNKNCRRIGALFTA